VTEPVPRVTFVIVTYLSLETIGAALDAIYPSWNKKIVRCIVVDNTSDDGTADFVTERFPWVNMIRSEENVGFGRGCNLGFQHVTTPYVFFLNPDATIDTPSIEAMIDFMDQHPSAAVVAPAIIESGDVYQAAGLMTTVGTLIRSSAGHCDPFSDARQIIPNEAPFQTTWVCGAAMLIRSELFRQIGGFDPRFFLYFEETDLCRRITEQRRGIWAVGTAVARHTSGHSAKATQQSLTSNCVSEHYYRSRFYYLIKHFGWTKAVAAEVISATLDRLRQVKRWMTRLPSDGVQRRTTRPFLKLPAQPRDSG
jgi:N-acetylglucosaminyl-diphospho-decaprenol L-rhamnosyltransferase